MVRWFSAPAANGGFLLGAIYAIEVIARGTITVRHGKENGKMAWWDRPAPTVGMEIAMDAAIRALKMCTNWWPKNINYYHKRDLLINQIRTLMTDHTVTIADVIGWIESRNDTNAMRFEPTVYARIHSSMEADKIIQTIRKIHNCTYETAAVIYSTSFGEFQMMGCSLYDPTLCNMSISIGDYFKNIPIETKQHWPIDNSGFTNLTMDAQEYSFTVFTLRRGIVFSIDNLRTSAVNREKFAVRYNGSPAYANNIVESLKHFGWEVI
jgi:hypothetical protein